jgi:UDP-N-acetylmuramoyl-tripeptide--D-alanyl-D-alanine ligase
VPTGLAGRIPNHHSVIVVPDVSRALWRLVQWQRNQSRAAFIGVTGSAGKTTTKEMIASVAMQRFPTLKSSSNNNLLGSFPSHLFRLHRHHQVAVLEMSPPKIHVHCRYAKPVIGVVTNIGEAHIGKFGNDVHNIVKAKQKLIDGVRPGGTVIVNADDRRSQLLDVSRFRGKVITVGIKRPATLQATHIRMTDKGMHFFVRGTRYFIPTWGNHNVYNALNAIAVGRLLHIPDALIQKGLRNYRVPPAFATVKRD